MGASCQRDRALSSETAFEVLAYAVERPEAQDTLEGIVEWWLLEHYIARQTRLVHAAVGELVARGFLELKVGADGRERYHLNRERLAEARSLIASWENEPEEEG